MSYIKLDRKMLNWGWMADSSVVALWVHILLSANFETKDWQGIQVNAGELITSVARLSTNTGLSTQQVRTALKKLESTNEITRKTTNNYTLIKVTKWGEYQTNNKQSTSRSTSQPTSHVTTTKEDKNIRIQEQEIYKEDCSPEFAEALDAFEEMRRRIRKPLTERAKQMMLKKLSGLAMDEETQIAILNQSTMNSWQGVFPLEAPRTAKKGMVNVLDL